jgi:hypothetical protein
MTPPESPEVLIQLWPPKVFAKGKEGIRVVAVPVRVLLYTTIACKIATRLGWLALFAFVMLS